MSMGGEAGFGGELGMLLVDTARGWSPSYSQVTTRDENVSYGGGVRARLIYDSLWHLLNNSLTALGWFQPTIFDTPPGTKKYRPVTLLKEQQNSFEPIEPNTMAFVPENMTDRPWELGSEFNREPLDLLSRCVWRQRRHISAALWGYSRYSKREIECHWSWFWSSSGHL